MLYDAVSLDIRYWTFRDNLVVSYQRVDNIKNISLHEDVFKSLFRNVDKNVPGDKTSHLSSTDTECVDRIQEWSGESGGTDGVEGTEAQDIKGILGN